MSRERVLALLRERQGEYLSGEAMSKTLGISRAKTRSRLMDASSFGKGRADARPCCLLLIYSGDIGVNQRLQLLILVCFSRVFFEDLE